MLLTRLTNGDDLRWANVDNNGFTSNWGGIEFGVEEWPGERIVHIGKTTIKSYDRSDYGSDALLDAILKQKKRLQEAAERSRRIANVHFLHNCE